MTDFPIKVVQHPYVPMEPWEAAKQCSHIPGRYRLRLMCGDTLIYEMLSSDAALSSEGIDIAIAEAQAELDKNPYWQQGSGNVYSHGYRVADYINFLKQFKKTHFW
jgi:hypothetical protein